MWLQSQVVVSVVEDDQFHCLRCPLYRSTGVSGEEAKWRAQLRLRMYHYRYSEPLSLKAVTEDNPFVFLVGHPQGMEKSGRKGVLSKLFLVTFKHSKKNELMRSGKYLSSLEGFLLTALCLNFDSLQNSNFSQGFFVFFKGQSISWWVGYLQVRFRGKSVQRGPPSYPLDPLCLLLSWLNNMKFTEHSANK